MKMKLMKLKEKNQFGIAYLSFGDVKTIRDACKKYAEQGSAAAKKLAEELEEELNNVEV